ncbi:MAG TPA: energy-coupling factor transporter transmembrane component T [Solirubrobacteraceae bacterium]|nr:energy-coupling factor transporter transmembrane component T [Solirubrobacteraceae bacterium]
MSELRTLLYRRLPSPLHAARAGVGACWALALTSAALLLYHPLALAALTLAILGAAAGAGVGREAGRALRIAVLVALPIVLVNVLVSRQGLTVFARVGSLGPFGEGDLTVEALVYGAVIALKVTILILVSTLASLAVDPDELLRMFRRLSFRSALTASLATRMVPVLQADALRLAEAQRTRPDGGARGARGRVALLAAIVSGSLDRALDVAATLETRGFATAQRAPRLARAWSRHDVAFAAGAVCVLVMALAGRAGDLAAFSAYPLLDMHVSAGTLGLCAGLIAVVLAPFADRRGVDS